MQSIPPQRATGLEGCMLTIIKKTIEKDCLNKKSDNRIYNMISSQNTIQSHIDFNNQNQMILDNNALKSYIPYYWIKAIKSGNRNTIAIETVYPYIITKNNIWKEIAIIKSK